MTPLVSRRDLLAATAAMVAAPASAATPSASMQEALDYVEGQKTTGFLVVRDRKTLVERNWPVPADAARFRATFAYETTAEGRLGLGASHRRPCETGAVNRMIAYKDNLIESQRQAIQADIDTRKLAAERNRLGQFATPNALAVDIARYVQSVLGRTKGSIRFADPSIGSGSFFSAALAVFGSKRMKSAVGGRTRSRVRRCRPRAVGRCRA